MFSVAPKTKPGYEFIEGVRELREAAGIKPAELANMLGVPESTLRNWEFTKKRAPEQMRENLAEIFGVSPEDLIATGSAVVTGPQDYEDRRRQLYRQRRSDPDWKCQVCGGSVRYTKSHPYCEEHWGKRHNTVVEPRAPEGRGRVPGFKLPGLKEIRKTKYRNARHVAETLGVRFQTYYKWESEVAGVDARTLTTLCNFFKVTPGELMGE